MTETICNRAKCSHYLKGCCKLTAPNKKGGICANFVNQYTSGEVYQTEFFKAVIDKESNEKFRILSHGKRILINDKEFFTEDDDREPPDRVVLTHGRTGVLVGSLSWVRDHWSEIIRRVAEFPDVTTLPLKEADGDGQK